MFIALISLVLTMSPTVVPAGERKDVPAVGSDLLFVSSELCGPASESAKASWARVLAHASNAFGNEYTINSSPSGRSIVAMPSWRNRDRDKILIWTDWRLEPVVLPRYSSAIYVSSSYIQATAVGEEWTVRLIDVRQPNSPISLPAGFTGALDEERLSILDDGRWIGVSKKGVLVGRRDGNSLAVEHEIELAGSPYSVVWSEDKSLIIANMTTRGDFDSDDDYRAIVISAEERKILYELSGYYIFERLQLTNNTYLSISDRNTTIYIVSITNDSKLNTVRSWAGTRRGPGPFSVSPSRQYVLGREANLASSFVIGAGHPLVVRTSEGKSAGTTFSISKKARSHYSGWLVGSDLPTVQ